MIEQIRIGAVSADKIDSNLLKTIGLTLLPFAVGFSTTLVLAIMDRILSTLRTAMGISTK